MNEDPNAGKYVPPADVDDCVKPGAGPTELMSLPIVPEDRLLRAIVRTIDGGHEAPLSTIGMIFRFLGSPRAWQLSGERIVLKLSAEHQEWLLGATLELLAQLAPGERYFTCPDPQVIYGTEWRQRHPQDKSNVAVIEQWYYLDSMPVEFVERIIALLQAKG